MSLVRLIQHGDDMTCKRKPLFVIFGMVIGQCAMAEVPGNSHVFPKNGLPDVMVFTAVVWLGMTIIWSVVSMGESIDTWKNGRARWTIFQSDKHCFQRVFDQRQKVTAYICYALALMLTGVVTRGFMQPFIEGFATSPTKAVICMIPTLCFFLLFTVAILPTAFINYLTSHICMTNEDVSIRSVVNRPNPMVIKWRNVTGVMVYRKHGPSERISKVVIQGRFWLNRIVIPGNHPEIEGIIGLIRKHVPDCFK